MEQGEAINILGAKGGDTDYQGPYDKRKALIVDRLNTAPTDVLREKYQQMLDQLAPAITAIG